MKAACMQKIKAKQIYLPTGKLFLEAPIKPGIATVYRLQGECQES